MLKVLHHIPRVMVIQETSVQPGRDKVHIVSFPRDMWVDVPGRGFAKINAAYAYGGEALATRTLESLVGVRMDHAAKIDFEGFTGLTTELGGVTVDNKIASETQGYAWPKGEVTIQGEEALVYVRQRYGMPNGDLDRAERQRAVGNHADFGVAQIEAVEILRLGAELRRLRQRAAAEHGRCAQTCTKSGAECEQGSSRNILCHALSSDCFYGNCALQPRTDLSA